MRQIRGFLMGIVASGSFGFLPLFSLPLMSSGISVSSLLTYRLLLAAIAMGIIVKLRGGSLRIDPYEFFELAVLAVCYFSSAMLLFMGYNYMNSGLATVLHFSYPVFTTLIMFLFYRQYISPVTLAAMVMAITGVLLSTGVFGASGMMAEPFGIFIVVLSGLAYALYMVLVNNRPRLRDMDNQRLTFYALLFSGVYFLAFSLCNQTMIIPSGVKVWGNLLVLSLFCTLLSNITLVEALKSIGATLGAVLGAVEPLTAVLIGVLFLGETLSTGDIVGMVLIIIAVVLIVLSPRIDRHIGKRLERFDRNRKTRH